jgi:hypothetical protein
VALVPGRESPDVGSLEVLPFEPQAQIAEVQDVPAHTFQGDTGYRWNLPRFAQARRSLQLQFVGLSASERDQLLEFLRVNVTFAWTPPGQVATAFIVTDRPTTSSDSSLTYGLSVRVFELVFTGGA